METRAVCSGVTALGLVALLQAGPVQADDRRNEIYVGTYSTAIAYDSSSVDDDTLTGGHVGYARDFNDHLGLRAAYFATEHDDYSSVEAAGYDVTLVAGRLHHGFNVWGGVGLFDEEWESTETSFSETFSGTQLQFGIGYSWEPVSLRWVMNFRDASDYKDFVNEQSSGSNYYDEVETAAAVSASLNLGIRF